MSVQLDDLVSRLRLDTSGLESGLATASSAVSRAGASMSQVGGTLTRGVTLPLAGIAVAGVKLAADFDKTMRQVAIATGGPSDALKKLAIQMGAETAFSANDASEAMLELAKGGMTAAQIQAGALSETMRLASAGGVGLAEASTYMANTMAVFGVEAKNADSVTTALAGAANASSASVDSLGQGLAQGALAAKNAGLSLQETTGVLSLFDANGLKGADAGTSLKSALNSLIPTTDKAKKSMQDLGLDFVKGNGAFESVSNIAGQLQQKLGPLTEAQRSLALETIFGSDGMRAATILMDKGAAGVVKYTKASRDSATTTKLANAAMEGTSGALERAQGSLETAALTIGDVLAPYVEKAAGFIENLANKFSSLPGGMQGAIVAFGAVAAIVGPLLVVLGAVVTAIGAIGLPVAGAIAGIALLVAALVLAYQQSATFQAVVKAAIGGVAAFITGTFIPAAQRIGTAFMGLVTVVTPIVLQLVGVVQQHMPQIMAAVQVAFDTIKSVVSTTMTVIRTVITVVTAVITGVWSVFGGTILSIISERFGAVVQIITGVFQVIKGVFDVIGGVLTGDWSRVWDGIKSIVSGALNLVVGIFRNAFAIITTVPRLAFTAIRAIVSAGFGALKGLVSSALGAIKGAFAAGWDAIKGGVSDAFSAIKTAASTGLAKIVSTAKELPGKIIGALAGIGGQVASIGGNIIDGIVSGIRAAASRLGDAAIAAAKAALDKVKGLLHIKSPSGVFRDEVGVMMMRGAADGIVLGAPLMARAATDAGKKATDAAKKQTPAMKRVGKILSDSFAEGIAGGQDHVVKVMGNLMEAVTKTHNAKAEKLVKSATRKLSTLGGAYDRLGVQLKGAKDALAAIQAQEDAYNARHSALGAAGGDLGSLDLGGTDAPVTYDAIAGALQKAADNAGAFDQVLGSLKTAGLSQDAIDQLIAKGPQAALAMGQAILAAGGPAVARINALQAQIAASGQSIQAKSSASMYDAGVAAAQGLVSGLESQMGAVEEQMTRIAKTMTKAIRKALKIKSPSRVMAGLGAFTGMGFAQGIDGTAGQVRRAAGRLADAALVPASRAASTAAATGATRGAVAPQVRVFIGDRELTDMVRTEVGDTLAPIGVAARQGSI